MILILLFVLILLFLHIQDRYYSTQCFRDVAYHFSFRTNGVFESEPVEADEVFINRKWLPLFWVRTIFSMPWELERSGENINAKGTFYNIVSFFSIMPFEKKTQHHRFTGQKRGYYRIRTLRASTGDMLNRRTFSTDFDTDAELYVYPKPFMPRELKININRIIGEIIAKRNIIEDHYLLRGIREYNHNDSFRHINWMATAKTGELRINQYDYTMTRQIMLILDCTIRHSDDPGKAIEEILRLCATISIHSLKRNIAVGFMSDGTDCVTNEPVIILPDIGPSHGIIILKSLAKLNADRQITDDRLFARRTFPLDRQISYLFLSQDEDGPFFRQYKTLRNLGYSTYRFFPAEISDIQNGLIQ